MNKPVEMEEVHNFGYGTTVNPDLEKILEEEKNPLPIEKLKVVGFIFLYTIIVLLIKGGENYPSIIGLTECGMGGYFFVLLHAVLSFIIAKSVAIQMFEKDAEK